MSVALVKEGFASVHFTGEKSQYANSLKSAEESAKSQKLRIWKDYVQEETDDKKEEEKIVSWFVYILNKTILFMLHILNISRWLKEK